MFIGTMLFLKSDIVSASTFCIDKERNGLITRFSKVNKAKSTFLKDQKFCLVVICLLDPMQLDRIEDRVLSESDKWK